MSCCAGSHKSNLRAPGNLIEKYADTVTEVNAVKGDVMIFTGTSKLLLAALRFGAEEGCGVVVAETAMHGTLPWTADHDRRVLAFKFSPSFSCEPCPILPADF